ncbi:MAG: aldose 1-epimerase [Sphingobacteriales bacterium]|nr:aldose 1-epimerase [Sphingobacteriales bacterium]OJY87248.1 MAG: hypothetical protein BGP14_09040 [Sphingobacteriales bacterium 44-15]
MFGIYRKQENGFDKIVLKNDQEDCTIEIIPSCGAMLHAFVIKDGKGEINLIDSYSSKKEYDEATESTGFKGLKLSPFPCRINKGSYIFNGTAHQFQPNRSGVVLHGFLYNKSFTITKEHADTTGAQLVLQYDYAGNVPGFPFPYTCIITYTLEKDNTLTVSTVVKNTGGSSMPVADGWHPYFTFGGKVNDLLLEFRSEEMLEFVNLIPTGKTIPFPDFVRPALIDGREIDNSFVLDFSQPQPMCILRDPASQRQLEIYPQKEYPYLQIYIPPHRRSIAIENLSAPPNAFNNGIGLLTLEPGEVTDFSTTYKVK